MHSGLGRPARLWRCDIVGRGGIVCVAENTSHRMVRFDREGKKVRNARTTVVHNGVPIHEDLELPNPTPGGIAGDERPEPAPLFLQDHNDPVQYRNIWVVDWSSPKKDN